MHLELPTPAWLVRFAIAAALSISTAEAGTPVALYPVHGVGLEPSEVIDAQDLLQSGLHAGARRDELAPRRPLLLEPRCGAAPSTECLAKLAGDGVVALAKAQRRNGAVVVLVSLVDGQGRRTRPVGFVANLVIQDLRAVEEALVMLEHELVRLGDRPPATVAVAPSGRGPVVEPAPPASITLAVAPPAAPRAAPAEAVRRPPVPWQTTAGTWCAASGAALLAGGTVSAILGKRLTSQLDQRANAGVLTPIDRASYDRVKTYQALANSLLVAGGLATATGLTLWAIAPDLQPTRGGAAIGVSGRFQ